MDAQLMRALAESEPVTGECELVVGPQHLDRVVRQGMLKAGSSLEVMTADLKAMLVPDGSRQAPSVIDKWVELAKRGVEVRVLHSGVPSGPALQVIRKAGGLRGLTLRRCPRVHAKAVVVDAAACYLGSANVTGAGLGAKGETRRNIEMGVWTRAERVVEAVLAEFNRVWEGAACEGCGRRDVCPVPLEEPCL